MARGNPWFNAVEQTLPQYVPLPFDELFKAGQQVQNRYDASLGQLEDTATGLASIESRLPGHQQYVSNLASTYRSEADQLLQKYNNRADDPQFNRELKRLTSKYANDPNLRTILMANEADKRNAELSARMAAEGRLFINPRATGIDPQGRIINDVGQVRGVNTLDDYRERLRIAAGARTEQGNLITNRPSLEQAQSEIMSAYQSNAPEIQDLRQAYISQGLSSEQAEQQVLQDLQRLGGEYAIEESTNWQKMNFEASERDRVQRRALASAKAKSNQQGSLGPYFISTQNISNDGRAILPEVKTINGDQKIPIAGKMNVDLNEPVENLPLSGDITVIGTKWGNDFVKKGGEYTIEEGSFQRVEVPYVINRVEGGDPSKAEKITGQILSQDAGWNTWLGIDGSTSQDIDIQTDDKGNMFTYLDKNKKVKAYVQPQAMKVYKDTKDNNTVYQKIGFDETITYLGPDAWKFANDSQSISKILYDLGIDPNSIPVEQRSQVVEAAVQNYYNQRKAPLFSKPGTTTPITDYYLQNQ